MTIAVQVPVPGFTLDVSGREADALKIKIRYDGSNPKFGQLPLLIREYWIVNPPSPCYRTLPLGSEDVLYYEKHCQDFDWNYGRFGCAPNLITLEERSTLGVRKVTLQVFSYEPKLPNSISVQCGCVVMDDTDNR